MLNKKYAQIIKYIIEAKGYISANELANKVKISSKSIGRYYDFIDTYAKQYNLSLISKRGIGYKIEGNKENIKNLSAKVEGYLSSIYFSDDRDEIAKKIIMLILKNGYITTEDIGTSLNYSVGIINNNIKYIKEILKKFNLYLNAKPYYGRCIDGLEIDIRGLIECYILKNNIDNLELYLDKVYIKERETAQNEALLYLEQKNIMLADCDFDTLINKIMIAIWRNRDGHIIDLKNETIQNYNTMYSLIKIISSKIKCQINEAEVAYISNYFINKNDEKDKIIKQIIDEAVDEILTIFNNDYRYDREFLETIHLHIKSFLMRFKNNMQSINPLIKDIKTKFAFEFSQAIFLANKIEKAFDIKLTEDEIGYLTVHFAVSNEKKLKVTSKNICIICHYGIGTGQLICEILKQNIKNLNVMGVYPTRYLDIAIKQNIDLIVSTVRISDKRIPIIYIDNIFGDDIFESVNKAFIEIEQRKKIVENLFTEKSFFKINADTKEDILSVACEMLQTNGLVNKNYYKEILEREKISSTEVGNEVCIPHTIITVDESSLIAVVILEKPILWNKSYVRIVFLGLFNTKESYNLEVFRYLYSFIKDKDTVDDMIKYANFDYFIKIIQRYS